MSDSICLVQDGSYINNIHNKKKKKTHLDHNHLDGDVVGQSDWCSEVLWQRHQQVQDGDYALGVDGWCGGKKTETEKCQ